jgi:hypothetical protein
MSHFKRLKVGRVPGFKWWHILKSKRISREGPEGGEVRKDRFSPSPTSHSSRDIADDTTPQISGFRLLTVWRPWCLGGSIAVLVFDP